MTREKGETHHSAKLDWERVTAIRYFTSPARPNDERKSQAYLAKLFDVSSVAIHKVVARKSWVDEPVLINFNPHDLLKVAEEEYYG